MSIKSLLDYCQHFRFLISGEGFCNIGYDPTELGSCNCYVLDPSKNSCKKKTHPNERREPAMFSTIAGKVLQRWRGFEYRCLRYSRGVCLIEAKNIKADVQIPRHYEVWILREPSGRFQNKWGVRFPSSEEFGSFGWCFCDREAAERKFNELVQLR